MENKTQVERVMKPRYDKRGKLLSSRKHKGWKSESTSARDALVDEFLSANSTAMLETDRDGHVMKESPGQNLQADADMAEEFEREFMAVAEARRNRRSNNPAEKGVSIGGVRKNINDGPRLGGSKNRMRSVQVPKK